MCAQFLIPIIIGVLAIQCTRGESSSSVGVIDLRPKLSPDRIYRVDNSLVGKAIFPTIEQSEDDSDPIYDDSTYDQQAAAAYCIGSECSTVYLMISYDFANEKTVLHRAFGGTKLMSFVDGTRKSWEKRRTKTKLIVLLVPSSASSENQLRSFLSSVHDIATDESETRVEIQDLTSNINESTMMKGAEVLVERLRSCFEFGGEDFQDVDIFQDSQFLCLFNLEKNDDGRIDDMVLNHQVKGVNHQTMREEEFEQFKQLIISSYESASGIGSVSFI